MYRKIDRLLCVVGFLSSRSLMLPKVYQFSFFRFFKFDKQKIEIFKFLPSYGIIKTVIFALMTIHRSTAILKIEVRLKIIDVIFCVNYKQCLGTLFYMFFFII